MTALALAVRRSVARVLFSERPFRMLGRLLGPTLMGRLCMRLVDAHAGVAGPACLCITRDVFAKDIHQLRARTARGWPSINQHLMYLCEQAWLPRTFFRQTAFQAQLPGLPPRGVRRTERYARTPLREARARHGVAAVLTANFDYAPDEFLRRAALDEGMPFLVLTKEHGNTDYGQRAFAASVSGYRFHGDGIAVFGPRTEALLLDEGICPPERIRITGPPRLDEWVDLPPAPERDLAVLFSFSRRDQDGVGTFPEVLERFAAAAAACPGKAFVVKCRDAYEEEVVRAMAARHAEHVAVTSATPVPELLRRAFVAVGFCSLAVTEALLSPATVVSPRFGDCRNEIDAQLDDQDPDVRALVRFPSSAAQLEEEIARAAGVEPSAAERAARVRIIHRMFCEPRPTYSALVDAFVADALASAGSRGGGASLDQRRASDPADTGETIVASASPRTSMTTPPSRPRSS